jgi:hypothetical protein
MTWQLTRGFDLSLPLFVGVGWIVVIILLLRLIGAWGLPSFKNEALSILDVTRFFAAPLCLVARIPLSLLMKVPAFSFSAYSFGSLSLSAIVCNSVYSDLHRNSAQASLGFGFLTMLVFAALFCDLCAIRLDLEWKRNRLPPGV